MNHTAYDVRLLANQVNIVNFGDLLNDISAAAADGQYYINVPKSKAPLKTRTKLIAFLQNLGYDVSVSEESLIVNWQLKEPKKT